MLRPARMAVSSAARRTEFFAHAAFFMLRACAATNRQVGCGLAADFLCDVHELVRKSPVLPLPLSVGAACAFGSFRSIADHVPQYDENEQCRTKGAFAAAAPMAGFRWLDSKLTVSLTDIGTVEILTIEIIWRNPKNNRNHVAMLEPQVRVAGNCQQWQVCFVSN